MSPNTSEVIHLISETKGAKDWVSAVTSATTRNVSSRCANAGTRMCRPARSRAKDGVASRPAWIGKLKEDMRDCGAEMGVLVTMPTAVPKEWDPGQPFALHEDVWVTNWPLAIHLAGALRAGLLDVHKQRLASTGKGEKMEAVYD